MAEVLELLTELIARESVTPNDAGCQDLIAERLGRAGFRVERMRFGHVDNLWAVHGESGPIVCLAGHTDVVPAGPREAWSSDPFEATVRDGMVVGRGASDMKASVAAMVVALERLSAQGHDAQIALLLTSDEEGPGVDGTRRVLDNLSERSVRIEAAIVGEPTCESVFGDTIKAGRRGSLHGRIPVRGIQGHTAYPHLADNAAHRLNDVLASLLEIEWGDGEGEFPATSLQVTHLSAGTGAGNVIPGSAEIRFNVRFGTDWTAERIQKRIQSALDRRPVGDIEFDVSALPFLERPGRLLQALGEAVESVTGTRPALSTGGGTSDARFFAAHRIPVAEFGPLNDTIHAANERIAISSLEPLADIYQSALHALSRI